MKKYYTIMAITGFAIWFLGTWHGGFSDEAQSSFEKMTDFVGFILMFWGIVGDVLQGLAITKNTNVSIPKEATVNLYENSKE